MGKNIRFESLLSKNVHPKVAIDNSHHKADFFMKKCLRLKISRLVPPKSDPKFGIDNSITGMTFYRKNVVFSKIRAHIYCENLHFGC